MKRDDEAATAIYAELNLGVLLQVAGRMMTEQLEIVAQESDLAAGHLSLLGVVCRFPGLGQNAYSEILAINDATLGRYVDRLVQRGMVDRRRSAQDRRAVRIYDTQAGRDCFAAATGQLEGFRREMRRMLPEGVSDQMADLLRLFVVARAKNLPDFDELNRGGALAVRHRAEGDRRDGF